MGPHTVARWYCSADCSTVLSPVTPQHPDRVLHLVVNQVHNRLHITNARARHAASSRRISHSLRSRLRSCCCQHNLCLPEVEGSSSAIARHHDHGRLTRCACFNGMQVRLLAGANRHIANRELAPEGSRVKLGQVVACGQQTQLHACSLGATDQGAGTEQHSYDSTHSASYALGCMIESYCNAVAEGASRYICSSVCVLSNMQQLPQSHTYAYSKA